MQRITYALIAAICCVACNQSSTQAGSPAKTLKRLSVPASWIDYKPANGACSIKFPKKPDAQKQGMPSTIPTATDIYIYTASSEPMIYNVNDTVNDTPFPTDRIDPLNKRVQDWFAVNAKAKVVSSNAEMIGGYRRY